MVDASRIAVSLRAARIYKSAALRSNAFHFAGDMAGSLAVLGGMVAVAAGFQDGDAIAALVVAGIIFAAASRLIYENARVLMDTTPADARAQAEAAISGLGDAVELRRLRLRESGGRYFADAVVGVPPGQAVVESHNTADAVEAAVRDALPETDVVVHLEPRREGLDLRDRVLAIALAEPLVREAHDIAIYEHDGRVSVSLHLKLDARRRDRSGARRRRARRGGATRGARRARTSRPTSSRSSSRSPPAPTRTATIPTRSSAGRITELVRRPHRPARRASCGCCTPTAGWSCSSASPCRRT